MLEWNMAKTDSFFNFRPNFESRKQMKNFNGHVLEAIFARSKIQESLGVKQFKEVLGININDNPHLQVR